MSISKVRSTLYRGAKLLGDIQAVRKGRVGHRIAQRHAGKVARKGLNKALKRLR